MEFNTDQGETAQESDWECDGGENVMPVLILGGKVTARGILSSFKGFIFPLWRNEAKGFLKHLEIDFPSIKGYFLLKIAVLA